MTSRLLGGLRDIFFLQSAEGDGVEGATHMGLDPMMKVTPSHALNGGRKRIEIMCVNLIMDGV